MLYSLDGKQKENKDKKSKGDVQKMDTAHSIVENGQEGCLVRKDGKVFAGKIFQRKNGVEVYRAYGPTLFFKYTQITSLLPIESCPGIEKKQKRRKKTQTKVLTEPTKTFKGEPIDIHVQDAPLQDVLNIIADVAHLNLLLAPGIQGKVTLRLKHVPWDQLLDMLSRMYRFRYSIEGNVLFIQSMPSGT